MRNKAWVGTACASMMALAGCVSAPPVPVGPQESYVDGKMQSTIDSIDQTLKVLVLLERGDQPARKAAPLGMTVAGASGVARPPIAVAAPSASASVLDKQVRINWSGSADQLLSQLASQLGMSYQHSGSSRSPSVRIGGEAMSVRQLLEQVARQTSRTADVRVDLPGNKIELITH